jgi:hypothetical protein
MTELVGARRVCAAAGLLAAIVRIGAMRARVRDGVPAASGNAIGDIR